MIKKLRRKLVITSMVSLLLVLLVIEGITGVLNYRKIVTDADRILNILRQNDGKFPEMAYKGPEGEKIREPAEIPKGNPGEGTLDDRNMIGRMSGEMAYESRFFSVIMNEDGVIVTVDTGRIASVDTSAAAEYARDVWRSGKIQGFTNNYRYLVCESGSGTGVRIIFLDRSRELSNFNNLIMTGLGVTAMGLAAVFLLMVFLSARITKPFTENYEKQKRFITDAGHELKTPLTIIDADTEVLEMDLGENEWLQDIQIQSRRLVDLTNDLIMLSRMEENRQETVRVEFPFSDMVEETVNTFHAVAKTQNKTLVSEITPMISVCGDGKALSRLVTILLDNAVKYSDDGGRIVVRLEKEKKRIHLSVYNTTEFISRKHLEHLFDRFYRTDSSRNSQTGGYGLGLSIAAATVEAHKGKITAATEDEKSLKITVTLPV
ncbi:MAG: HAMP domain-containing sensor histidine kinase [Blautia sp.]|nr:HAMP domain-containing histidine kinase [Blautia sp.]MDY3997823.1 HAMP domain-containing sensor histidine kinase [Blautia sp.]